LLSPEFRSRFRAASSFELHARSMSYVGTLPTSQLPVEISAVERRADFSTLSGAVTISRETNSFDDRFLP
jgi:hypothetical protein